MDGLVRRWRDRPAAAAALRGTSLHPLDLLLEDRPRRRPARRPAAPPPPHAAAAAAAGDRTATGGGGGGDPSSSAPGTSGPSSYYSAGGASPRDPRLRRRVGHALGVLPCLRALARAGARPEFSTIVTEDFPFMPAIEAAMEEFRSKEAPENVEQVVAGLRRRRRPSLTPSGGGGDRFADELGGGGGGGGGGGDPNVCALCCTRRRALWVYRECKFCGVVTCEACSSKRLPAIHKNSRKENACDACFNQACYWISKLQASFENTEAFRKQQQLLEKEEKDRAELLGRTVDCEEDEAALADRTVMAEVITGLGARGHRLESIDSKTTRLADTAANFRELTMQLADTGKRKKTSWWGFG